MLWSGAVTGADVLMVIEHVARLVGMAGVMLLRPSEFTHHHGGDRQAAAMVTGGGGGMNAPALVGHPADHPSAGRSPTTSP